MIRQPAVAGRFYPGNSAELTETIQKYVHTSTKCGPVIGAVVPHAGYMYSGQVAGSVYSRIEIPPRNIILCPNHTGLGPPLSIMRTGVWQTPLGDVAIDTEMADALMAGDSELVDDFEAHRHEHALEVQLPFMQYMADSVIRFVPITIGTGALDDLQKLGRVIAAVIRQLDPSTLILASSDMSHYEPDGITRIKDRLAIDRILELDPKGLYETVHREKISMCGFGPATAMLVAARNLGATRAELVEYATSGDVSQDFDRVVGYAGVVVC